MVRSIPTVVKIWTIHNLISSIIILFEKSVTEFKANIIVEYNMNLYQDDFINRFL